MPTTRATLRAEETVLRERAMERKDCDVFCIGLLKRVFTLKLVQDALFRKG